MNRKEKERLDVMEALNALAIAGNGSKTIMGEFRSRTIRFTGEGLYVCLYPNPRSEKVWVQAPSLDWLEIAYQIGLSAEYVERAELEPIV